MDYKLNIYNTDTDFCKDYNNLLLDKSYNILYVMDENINYDNIQNIIFIPIEAFINSRERSLKPRMLRIATQNLTLRIYLEANYDNNKTETKTENQIKIYEESIALTRKNKTIENLREENQNFFHLAKDLSDLKQRLFYFTKEVSTPKKNLKTRLVNFLKPKEITVHYSITLITDFKESLITYLKESDKIIKWIDDSVLLENDEDINKISKASIKQLDKFKTEVLKTIKYIDSFLVNKDIPTSKDLININKMYKSLVQNLDKIINNLQLIDDFNFEAVIRERDIK